MSVATILKRSQAEKEAWRYTDPRFLEGLVFAPREETQINTETFPKAVAMHRLVFVDGVFKPDLSALSHLPPGLLTAADDGVCEIQAEAQHCLALAPIEMLCLWTGTDRPKENAVRVSLSLGESARLTFIERHVSLPGTMPAVQEIAQTINLGKQAKLIHGIITKGSESSVHFSQTDVQIAKGAFYDRASFVAGGKLVRCEVGVDLNGEMAEARMHGINLLSDSTHADTSFSVRHNAPNGISRQLIKNVLSDKARGVFQGKVFVAPKAQKTDAHQLSRALLLSPLAEMNAKPELEIFADDVKCSHGSTIGDLDETALFYLRSRGIDAARARAMLVHAFVGDVIDQIQSEELAALVRGEVGKVLL